MYLCQLLYQVQALCKGQDLACTAAIGSDLSDLLAWSWVILMLCIHVMNIRRPESAWLANILCRIQTVSTDPNPSPKSKIQNPKSKIQNPKSEIQNPKSKIQNPKSKIQNPKSEIQTGPFGAATNPERGLNRSKIQNPKSEIHKSKNRRSKIRNPKSKIQNPKSKIQTPNSKIQNPNGPFGVWILDFGFGRAGAGGDGHVANEDVWPCWPPELGLVGGTQACNRKVAGSIPPTRGPNWAPISGGEVLPEIGARFPAPCRGNRSRISGESAGQAALLETLGQHRARKKNKPSEYTYI